VRRAIAAIELVAIEPPNAPSVPSAGPVTAPPPPQLFAPPTPDMRAEVIYATQAASHAEPITDGEGDNGEVDGGDERSSALRRLIGSLRRKDH
jgi:hypothetical protein